MKAIVTNGTGGYDKLEFQDVPVPTLGDGEVLIKVLASEVYPNAAGHMLLPLQLNRSTPK